MAARELLSGSGSDIGLMDDDSGLLSDHRDYPADSLLRQAGRLATSVTDQLRLPTHFVLRQIALSIRDLRRQWKPHKERLALLQNDYPTSVRFHRACSWLDQSQQLDREGFADVVLLEQWTALNALYGPWNAAVGEPHPDRAC